MGVKTTRTMDRSEAERLYVDLHVRWRERRREEEIRLELEHLRTRGTLSLTYPLSDLGLDDAQIRDVYVQVDALRRRARNEAKAKAALAAIEDDVALEDELERYNDALNDGEGYNNYSIQRNPAW